ncbi:hypothetical protein BKE38_02795 [Pseudoroseomonas deserti]|uniref:Uncharacterized protein n=1 Tax=Teichococcus deserti TaxID=1817963 RepID=A0A1V2H778_9PROT|nr:hypothetical protein [Pseudoroseomonas deserti]ONG58586.1 hypothetical protein BKE38_02795 [Pseudoroseomonas deserti]
MAGAERLAALLPSLWRPELSVAGAAELLPALLRAAGAQLDSAGIAAGDILQAHWFRYADSALTSPFVARGRQLSGQKPLLPGAPEAQRHPYLDDLPRLASLLGLAPWREPDSARETVEEFRRRVARLVALYREGLGSRAAMLGMALASLPPADRDAAAGLTERGLSLQEFAPAALRWQAVASRGAPEGMLGALMRFAVDSGAVLDSTAMLVIQGVAPEAGRIAATEQPMLERFDPATGRGVGIAYAGTLAPDQALAILPAFTSWLGGAEGIATARHTATPALPADPTAPGPWAAATGAPEDSAVALVAAADGALWAAVNGAAAGALWRFDGTAWAAALEDLPLLQAMVVDGDTLLLGTATGLARLPVLVAPLAATTVDGPAVQGFARAEGWWLATATGCARLGEEDAIEPLGPGTRAETRARFAAVWADADGPVFFGGEAGLFRHDPARGLWHVYGGGSGDETVPDWTPWDPAADALPTARFLPPVTALRRGADRSLWIGTASGIARYRAQRIAGTYATLLQAWPELGAMPVSAIAEDERQSLWFATGRGLLTFDGIDWRQAQDGSLARLPRAAEAAPRHWRFDRDAARWQVRTAGGFAAATPELLTTVEAAVQAIAWTDGATGLLGSFDGSRFTASEDAPAALQRRARPEATRILTGGIPAVPRLPPGRSQWRYLQVEEADPPTPRSLPAWTREGRLLPPPEEAAAPMEARFLAGGVSEEEDQVFSFDPSAKIWIGWQPRAAFSVTLRLQPAAATETMADPVLDRLQQGLDRVRPAGVRVRIALGETVVRGGEHG